MSEIEHIIERLKEFCDPKLKINEKGECENILDFLASTICFTRDNAETLLKHIDKLEKENNRLKDELGYTRKLV